MRRNQTQNISEIIAAILKANGMEDKLSEVRLIKSWEELLGKSVARRTKDLQIRNRTLFVTLTSPVARNELMMIRDELIKRLNEQAGKQVIDKIVLR